MKFEKETKELLKKMQDFNAGKIKESKGDK